MSQELLSSITTHSILGDSEAKNRDQKKWMTSLSHLLFFMADARLSAKRGLTEAHCLSLCLIRKKQNGSQEEKKTSPPPLWVTIWFPANCYSHTHIYKSTHTHTQTPTHVSIILCRNRVISAYWWLSPGMNEMGRSSSPIKCQTQLYSWIKLSAGPTTLLFLMTIHFPWVTQILQLWTKSASCYISMVNTE